MHHKTLVPAVKLFLLSLALPSELHHTVVYVVYVLIICRILVRMVLPKGITLLCMCRPACHGSCKATPQVMPSLGRVFKQANAKGMDLVGCSAGTFLNWRIYYIGVGWLLEETVRCEHAVFMLPHLEILNSTQ